MPLINTSVPNLIQGVSQQADATRFSGQCTEQENALSSVAAGLQKRPNTRHVSRLLQRAISEDSFVHFIDRNESEKYVIIHDGHCLRAFNILTGVEATINGVKSANNNGDGLEIPATGSLSYLKASDPKSELRALTVGDNTFLLNTYKGVSLKQNSDGSISRSPPLATKALIFVKQGDYKKEYAVHINSSVNGGAGAIITLGLVGYTHPSSTPKSGFRHSTGYRITRWRVNSVTVSNGGGNYSNDLSITLSSNAGIYEQPKINFNIVGGIIQTTGHTIVNTGDFAGVGTTFSRYYQRNVGEGATEPTLSNITIVDNDPQEGTAQVTASITSGDGIGNDSARNADTTVILGNLKTTATNGLDAKFGGDSGGFYIKQNASTNLIEMVRKDGSNFTISSSDGIANNGLGVVYKEVGSITDLPLVAPDGFEVKVRGDAELNQDDYYVRFETTNGQQTIDGDITSTVGEGVWVECVAPDLPLGLNPATLPHSLINDGVGTFQLKETEFADRFSGDDLTNPLPSILGERVSNIFFFKNRLGLLSNDNIVMTEAGFGGASDSGRIDYNLSRTTVTTLLDSDPIDISVASSKVTNLKSAQGFQENLILFSDAGQFVMKGGELLTPRTVSVAPVTNFDFDAQVNPLSLGSYIYFPFIRGDFTGVREFSVNSTTDIYDSTEVTEHVPAYIPRKINHMVGTTSEDMIAISSYREQNAIYVYNYFWSNNQKILSAWSKFTFTGDIRGVDFVDSTLYMVITTGDYNSGETNLVSLPLESGLIDDAGYITYLDMRVHDTITVGNSTLTLPYTPADNSVEVYDIDGEKLPCSNSGASVTLSSPITKTPNISVTEMLKDRVYTIVSVGTTDFSKFGLTNVAEDSLVAGQTYQIIVEGTGFTDSGASSNSVGTVFTATGNNSTGTTGLAIDISVGQTFTAKYDQEAPTGTGVVSRPNVFVGIPYTMKYTFSEQLFKAKAGSGTSATNAAKLLIRNGSLYYDKSAHFKVKVTPKLRGTSTSSFTARAAGSENVGDIKIDSGFFRFTVFTQPEDTVISIENDSALPSTFQSAEFESFVHTRSSRYG